MLILSQDSLTLSEYSKNITALMSPFRRSHQASLALVHRQWYELISVEFCFSIITVLLMSDFSVQGIMYLGSPLYFALLQRFPLQRRVCAVAGLVLMAIALVTSSFATRVWHLILTQGVLYAIGGSMLYSRSCFFLGFSLR